VQKLVFFVYKYIGEVICKMKTCSFINSFPHCLLSSFVSHFS